MNNNLDYYEIHLTLKSKDESNLNIEYLQEISSKVNNKLILLDLEVEYQITTAKTICGTIDDAMVELNYLTSYYNQYVNVVRKKLETTPWNVISDNYPEGYYESHFTFQSSIEDKPYITKMSKLYGLHMSKNSLKIDIDNITKFMGTSRSHSNNKMSHMNKINYIINYLNNNGIYPIKTETEFVIYDSNIEIDNKWINQ